MTQTIRPATPGDIPRMVALLMLDAQARHAQDAVLWKMAQDAEEQIAKALTLALSDAPQPVHQIWQVAAIGDRITGVAHGMLLPVPPIYAGPFGMPGLILPDCFVAPGAPDGTVGRLLAAAEDALRRAGARLLLSAHVVGEDWRGAFEAKGYDPITLYFSRADIGAQQMPADVRPATMDDVPAIVARSAEHRKVLFGIDPFWEIHPLADRRFGAWMARSLDLRDRDMMVLGPPDALGGYVIAQPASRLHFPPAHAIEGTGVIDDYFHPDLMLPAGQTRSRAGARALVQAAEAAFARRGMDAAFVVCPAGWAAKTELLEAAGYRIAMVWSIRR